MTRLLCFRWAVLGAGIVALCCALPPLALADGAAGDEVHIAKYETGGLIASVGFIITLAVEVFRSPRLGRLVERIPRRWRITAPVALSIAAGFLSSISDGVPWQQAVYIGVFSGPTAVFTHELLVEAVAGDATRREERARAAEGPLTGAFTSHRAP